MKTLKISQVSLVLLIAAAGGCATSPISRIDSDRARYESWPVEVKEAVLAGEARKGMTAEQVEMAMGKPTEVVHRSTSDGDEIWIYRKGGGSGVGSTLLNNASVGVGTGVGPVGVYSSVPLGNGQRSVPEEEEVVFINGVVSRGTSR